MKSTINNILAACGLVAMTFMAPEVHAVPAYPGPVTYRNADGTTVTIQLHGDEWFNYATTPDGWPVMLDSQGVYRYAVLNAAGKVVASDVKVADGIPANTGIDPQPVMQAILAEAHQAPAMSAKAMAWDRDGTTEKIGKFPVKGSPKVLVVLIEYQDVEMRSSSIDLFNRSLNGKGYNHNGATGSALEYFSASSNGQFTPQFDIYGPVKVSKNREAYGADLGGERGNDSRGAADMIAEALKLLDSEIDYSQYDNDGDGQVDIVYAFYAGQGQADGGPASSIWPHAWYLSGASKALTLDGVRLDRYATSCELSTSGYYTPQFTGIGTFCHEFSHVMGLPDLYDTDYSGAFHPGAWDIMSSGSYNNNSNTPPLYSGYERYVMGWVTPDLLKKPENVTLKHYTTEGGYGDVRVIPTISKNEYYIIENRQKKGWDTFLPHHGMLVWHIDYLQGSWAANNPNNDISRQRIDIVEADNIQSDGTLTGDPFPGTAGVTSFTDNTTPSMIPRIGGKLDCPLTYIKESPSGEISFLFKGGEITLGDYVKLHPAQVTHDSALLSWDAAEGVDDYYVNLVHPDGRELISMAPADGCSMKLEDLDHTSRYQYTVAYYADGKLVGTSSSFTTTIPPLDMRRPDANDAAEIDETSMLASWLPLEDATTYTVDLFNRAATGPATLKESFDDSTIGERWTSNIDRFIDRSGFYTKAPAAFLEETGQYLLSPEFYGEIDKISFWVRNVSTPGSSVMRVKVRPSAVDNWKTVLEFSPTYSKTTKRLTTEEIGQGMHQFIIEFELGTTAVALDDVSVSVTDDMAYLPVEELTSIPAGEALSLRVNGLTPSTDYAYTVTGHSADGNLHSLPSAPVFFATTRASGIEDVAASSLSGVSVQVNSHAVSVQSAMMHPVYIYNVTGEMVFSGSVSASSPCTVEIPVAGIYFVKVGLEAFKIIVK